MLKNNKVKIICTIGPNSLNKTSLKKFYLAGMSVARLNGSHSDLNWHIKAVKTIRKLFPDLPILFDIPGKKIRTLQLKSDYHFKKGNLITLTTDCNYKKSDKVPINYSLLHKDVKAGDIIMADDGTLKFKVKFIKGKDIIIKSQNKGVLKSRKGINIPKVIIKKEDITKEDKKLLNFACKFKLEFIGLSFIESKSQIDKIKKLIKNQVPKIVSKIENSKGIRNVNEISKNSDIIMIDRGDLSTETNLQTIALNQKKIIEICKKNNCPVILATEMLNSMVNNPFPTKAEITDISNAVMDGCSATMLSGETAVGEFAEESIKFMKKTILSVENYISKNISKKNIQKDSLSENIFNDYIGKMVENSPVTKIVIITRSGYAARVISSKKPEKPILAISDDKFSSKSFNLFPGTKGIYYKQKFPKNTSEHVFKILSFLFKNNYISKKDNIIVTGLIYPYPGCRMNFIQYHRVLELVKNFKW